MTLGGGSTYRRLSDGAIGQTGWPAAIEGLVDLLADRLADRVLDRLRPASDADPWLSLADAAEHLGLHRDTLRKHAKAGLISFEQEAPGCRIFFRRADLDAWRQAGGAPARLAQVAHLPPKRSTGRR